MTFGPVPKTSLNETDLKHQDDSCIKKDGSFQIEVIGELEEDTISSFSELFVDGILDLIEEGEL